MVSPSTKNLEAVVVELTRALLQSGDEFAKPEIMSSCTCADLEPGKGEKKLVLAH